MEQQTTQEGGPGPRLDDGQGHESHDDSGLDSVRSCSQLHQTLFISPTTMIVSNDEDEEEPVCDGDDEGSNDENDKIDHDDLNKKNSNSEDDNDDKTSKDIVSNVSRSSIYHDGTQLDDAPVLQEGECTVLVERECHEAESYDETRIVERMTTQKNLNEKSETIFVVDRAEIHQRNDDSKSNGEVINMSDNNDKRKNINDDSCHDDNDKEIDSDNDNHYCISATGDDNNNENSDNSVQHSTNDTNIPSTINETTDIIIDEYDGGSDSISIIVTSSTNDTEDQQGMSRMNKENGENDNEDYNGDLEPCNGNHCVSSENNNLDTCDVCSDDETAKTRCVISNHVEKSDAISHDQSQQGTTVDSCHGEEITYNIKSDVEKGVKGTRDDAVSNLYESTTDNQKECVTIDNARINFEKEEERKILFPTMTSTILEHRTSSTNESERHDDDSDASSSSSSTTGNNDDNDNQSLCGSLTSVWGSADEMDDDEANDERRIGRRNKRHHGKKRRSHPSSSTSSRLLRLSLFDQNQAKHDHPFFHTEGGVVGHVVTEEDEGENDDGSDEDNKKVDSYDSNKNNAHNYDKIHEGNSRDTGLVSDEQQHHYNKTDEDEDDRHMAMSCAAATTAATAAAGDNGGRRRLLPQSSRNRRLTTTAEETNSSMPNLPHCRVPLQGLPSEADRKRILGCLAVLLAVRLDQQEQQQQNRPQTYDGALSQETQTNKQYSYHRHDNDDVAGTEKDDESLLSSPRESSRSSRTFYNTFLNKPKIDDQRGQHRHHFDVNAVADVDEEDFTSSSDDHSGNDSSSSSSSSLEVSLFHRVAKLLFLDPYHAKAMEPILYIRPPPSVTPTSTSSQQDVQSLEGMMPCHDGETKPSYNMMLPWTASAKKKKTRIKFQEVVSSSKKPQQWDIMMSTVNGTSTTSSRATSNKKEHDMKPRKPALTINTNIQEINNITDVEDDSTMQEAVTEEVPYPLPRTLFSSPTTGSDKITITTGSIDEQPTEDRNTNAELQIPKSLSFPFPSTTSTSASSSSRIVESLLDQYNQTPSPFSSPLKSSSSILQKMMKQKESSSALTGTDIVFSNNDASKMMFRSDDIVNSATASNDIMVVSEQKSLFFADDDDDETSSSSGTSSSDSSSNSSRSTASLSYLRTTQEQKNGKKNDKDEKQIQHSMYYDEQLFPLEHCVREFGFVPEEPTATASNVISKRQLFYQNLLEPFVSQLSNQSVGKDCMFIVLMYHLLLLQRQQQQGSEDEQMTNIHNNHRSTNKNTNGYDARHRCILKQLAVLLIVGASSTPSSLSVQDRIRHATRMFERMERTVARVLIHLNEVEQQDENTRLVNDDHDKKNHDDNNAATTNSPIKSSFDCSSLIDKTRLWRTLKITSATLAAGTVFAVTGGLAGPGAIAAAAGAAGVTFTLTSHTAATAAATFLGIGGGSLVGYKLNRRIQGLREFEFHKAPQHAFISPSSTPTTSRMSSSNAGQTRQHQRQRQQAQSQPELYTVVCLGGWLRDYRDFFKPWGAPLPKFSSSLPPPQSVSAATTNTSTATSMDDHVVRTGPSSRKNNYVNKNAQQQKHNAHKQQQKQQLNPNLKQFEVLLTQFYRQYNPDHVERVSTLLEQWKGEEDQLGLLLESKYGLNPFLQLEEETSEEESAFQSSSSPTEDNSNKHLDNTVSLSSSYDEDNEAYDDKKNNNCDTKTTTHNDTYLQETSPTIAVVTTDEKQSSNSDTGEQKNNVTAAINTATATTLNASSTTGNKEQPHIPERQGTSRQQQQQPTPHVLECLLEELGYSTDGIYELIDTTLDEERTSPLGMTDDTTTSFFTGGYRTNPAKNDDDLCHNCKNDVMMGEKKEAKPMASTETHPNTPNSPIQVGQGAEKTGEQIEEPVVNRTHKSTVPLMTSEEASNTKSVYVATPRQKGGGGGGLSSLVKKAFTTPFSEKTKKVVSIGKHDGQEINAGSAGVYVAEPDNGSSNNNNNNPVSLLHHLPSRSTSKKKSTRKRKQPHEQWKYYDEYSGELYTVIWESELLMELCDSVTDMAVGMIGDQFVHLLKQTALHSLLNAISIPYALVNATHMIDGVWTLAIERADEAGKELARVLLESNAGHRPVTLCGTSMGARIIYVCLKELVKHQHIWLEQQQQQLRQKQQHLQCNQKKKNHQQNLEQCSQHKRGQKPQPSQKEQGSIQFYKREPASIVEDVYLLGCPQHVSVDSWKAIRQNVIGGRLVNCYSKNDLILGLMFQLKRVKLGSDNGAGIGTSTGTGTSTSLSHSVSEGSSSVHPQTIFRPVCGTTPICHVHGVENYDVSHIIGQHADYCSNRKIRDIFNVIGYGEPNSSGVSDLLSP